MEAINIRTVALVAEFLSAIHVGRQKLQVKIHYAPKYEKVLNYIFSLVKTMHHSSELATLLYSFCYKGIKLRTTYEN